MNDNIGLIGRLKIVKVSPNGNDQIETTNTIVTVGKSTIAGLILSGTNPNMYEWMALGLGSSTITAGDTVLGSEAYKIQADNLSQTTTTVTNDTATFIGSFGIDDTKTINEAGLFNGSGLDVGSMLSRTTFANIVATSGDSVNVTWDVTAG